MAGQLGYRRHGCGRSAALMMVSGVVLARATAVAMAYEAVALPTLHSQTRVVEATVPVPLRRPARDTEASTTSKSEAIDPIVAPVKRMPPQMPKQRSRKKTKDSRKAKR